MTVVEHPRGLRVAGVFDDSPAKRAGHQAGRPDHQGQRQVDRGRVRATSRPRGSRARRAPTCASRSSGRGKPARAAARAARAHPGAGRRRRRCAARTGASSACSSWPSFTSGAHGELADEINASASSAAPRGSCSTCAPTAAACWTRPCWSRALFVPDGVIVTTKGRKRPKRVFEATGDTVDAQAGGGAGRPRHGERVRDRDGRAARAPRRAGRRAGARSARASSARSSTSPTAARSTSWSATTTRPTGHNLNDKGITPDVRAVGQSRHQARRGARARAARRWPAGSSARDERRGAPRSRPAVRAPGSASSPSAAA